MPLELTVDEILSSDNVKVDDINLVVASSAVESFDVAMMLRRGWIEFKREEKERRKMLEIRDINYVCDKFY